MDWFRLFVFCIKILKPIPGAKASYFIFLSRSSLKSNLLSSTAKENVVIVFSLSFFVGTENLGVLYYKPLKHSNGAVVLSLVHLGIHCHHQHITQCLIKFIVLSRVAQPGDFFCMIRKKMLRTCNISFILKQNRL